MPTATPTPTVPPTATPLPVIEFDRVSSITRVPSQIQIGFSLRDENGETVTLTASEVKSALQVHERGPGTEGWEQIDYSETSFFVRTSESSDFEVVFVLDFTKSMADSELADGRTGIEAMLGAFDAGLSVLPSAYRVGVVAFHDRNIDPIVLSPLTTDPATVRSSVLEFASSGIDHGSSRVWDAVAKGLGLFTKVESNPTATRALIFMSDGRDTSSVATRDSLRWRALEKNAQLYALGLGDVFESPSLRGLVRDTAGGYYASDVSGLAANFQQMVNDLIGQYRLSYITLRRSGEYETRLSLNLGRMPAEKVVGPFDVSEFFGPDNQGIVTYDPSRPNLPSGVATVYVRAGHVPRNIDQIRFNPGVERSVLVEIVSSADGGIIDGWTLTGPDDSGFYKVSSDSPIEFGASGLLFKLTFDNVAEQNFAVDTQFDNTIYGSGKQLVYPATLYVGQPRRIVFASRIDGDDEIYSINSDGTGLVKLTDNEVWDIQPAWSPDGTQIAFASFSDGDLEIYVMNDGGSDVAQLTHNDGTEDRDPDWSPDGTRISFGAERGGYDGMYIMNADGSDPVGLTDIRTSYNYPQWSPDGNRFVFSYFLEPHQNDVFVVNADGSGLVQITATQSHEWSPTWSPDGTQLAFTSNRDGNNDIYVMNSDGSNVVNVTQHVAVDQFPAWSPDGRRIVFVSDRSGNYDLYIIKVDGTGLVRLTDDAAYESDPDWNP